MFVIIVCCEQNQKKSTSRSLTNNICRKTFKMAKVQIKKKWDNFPMRCHNLKRNQTKLIFIYNF